MFSKILIANRGAIAVRIIRTLRRMGIAAVAVYAEDDADSRHVLLADEAYSLGAGRVSETYLNQDKLFEIMRCSGAQAVHPGYGFLSENADFVQRCEAEGVTFIGPTTAHMAAFGLKHEARRLAGENQVPLLSGSGLVNDLDDALMSAQQIGYPVMLKSTAGGGGIGMQLCHDEAELRAAFDSVRRLSASNFANSGVFLEKFIARARHIEVQVFGDGQGQAIALGERDCSCQRRNQKVIEETPAPGLSAETRQALHETATRLLRAVAYRNAGTVEFVYDQETRRFYFLEVNTRLQVEHGVTEQVYGVDLVQWMVELAAGVLPPLDRLARNLQSNGHSIQARLYAEDPNKQFQPAAGLLTQVDFPAQEGLRIDTWIESGIEVPAQYDPLLAKVIATAPTREAAIAQLQHALGECQVFGIETNRDYVCAVLASDDFAAGAMTTRALNRFEYAPHSIDVLSAGTLTTIQDCPGRSGYWDVGVPPSGPFDSYSFRLGNRLLGNDAQAAGLELTLTGPTLRFNNAAQIVLTGAPMRALLDEQEITFWEVVTVRPGQVLRLDKVGEAGARSYLLIKGGLQCPAYLGSRATFTLGQFGGHGGRALRTGDVLHLAPLVDAVGPGSVPPALRPNLSREWQIQVIYGPHGAPDFFTESDIEAFFNARWEVHYNSSRTGIRLVGPKPQWARSDGGEAGMHPSNIHDNAYAIGTIDFTGDMPVILGPDGPSLGGFVCPATVISADLWKLGQLKASDKVRFIPVAIDAAVAQARQQDENIAALGGALSAPAPRHCQATPVVHRIEANGDAPQVVYRPAGDNYLLVEYGPLMLDVRLRFRVHALMLQLQQQAHPGIRELTPGIRSLQVHYDNRRLSLPQLLQHLEAAEQQLQHGALDEVPARIVHLPLSWDDAACRLAIEKYMKSVRQDAPWCPSNIEFIRRINGLDSIEAVKSIVFDASYLVMGLGDVYLGAPVATPIDPRHRLVTTKYNPARTWTAENSVGIGGSYLCIYGMEGPGGYQFVGRTLQMWSRYKQTDVFQQPWLLRFFDQIRFYEVSDSELQQIRRDFPRGRYPIHIEQTTFSLRAYEEFLAANAADIAAFNTRRNAAFEAELQRWVASGQINFNAAQDLIVDQGEEEAIPDNCSAIESPVAGSVWKLLVRPGQTLSAGQPLVIMESMKMEVEVTAPHAGVVYAINREEGQQVGAGQALLILQQP